MITACKGPNDSANGQDWHRQFHSLENSVIRCILRKRCELREASPHAARLCVSGCEEISGSFVRFRRITCEIVPDSVEIDAFPSCYKPLGIGPVEVEMPDARIQENGVPWLDAGNRCIHDDQTINLVLVHRGIGVSDHVADVVSDDGSVVESESGYHSPQVLCLRL